ncbi:hypothetical protein [Spirosoma sp. KNUC1025]|uniref:hypothetical protein n=1 Tax=Spirosoma sp. KNUC1025 TaxID=2894082 RepID=UPI00386B2F9A|nr:hypothetical protein LN737_12835 [Spirosoma sp. KNUC1025]
MYKQLPLVIAVVLAIFFAGCQGRKQASDQSADSSQAASETSGTTTEVAITGHLAELGLTKESDWRGINIGDDFAKVKTTEKGEAFESDAQHVGYTVEFANLETADMLYYQADQKVSAIDVDLFLNSRQSVTTYQNELQPYFSSRFGAPKTANGGTTWTGAQGKTVTLKDVSKGKDFGLKIKIASANGPATASAK